MSGYGFSTLDQNGNAAINAKNPIFGFDMGHRPMAFKTFRFRDVKTPPIHTGNVPTPNPNPVDSWGYAQNMDTGEVPELIKKVKHGYNFRPVGYATITGTWKKTRRVQITQTQRAGTWGGNYTKTMIVDYGDNTWDLVPNPFNAPWIATTGVDYPGSVVSLNPEDFSGTIWAYEYPKSVFCYMAPYGTDRWHYTQEDCPIWVEFDDEYIYFYRKWSWSDTIRRCKFTWGGTTDQDIQERVKVSASFAGSDFDVTVYLCPYPLKELL